MRILVAVTLAFLWIGPARADQHTFTVEQACFNAIQGRVAWNEKGDRRWSPDNIHELCSGTRNPSEPGRCFQQVMGGSVDWGGGRQWQWKNAVALCRGSNDAEWTIGCFRQSMSRRLDWRQAISHCAGMQSEYERYPDYGFSSGWQQGAPRPASCHELVQGRVAWNLQGDTIWADRYLDRLCHGSEVPAEPGRCYEQVMHGGVNWGGGTRWEPDNVLNLCAGTNNAERTIGCFEDAIHRGLRWDAAISRCSR